MFKKYFNRNITKKVPEVIVIFWIIKLLTTAFGESTSDYLVHTIDPVVAVLLGAVFFFFALGMQLWVRRYIAWVYWLAVAMIAVFGTMVADVLHVGMGVPYLYSTTFFAVSLLLILLLWYSVEKTLSIHSIMTPRRELFYWATVCATFALGTAAGDMTAVTFNLGYFTSGVLFAVLFALPIIAYKIFHVNEVFTFWFAYIMTRPFGASFADWFGRPPDMGGIGLGTGKTSIVLGIFIIFFIVYLVISHKDIKKNNS